MGVCGCCVHSELNSTMLCHSFLSLSFFFWINGSIKKKRTMKMMIPEVSMRSATFQDRSVIEISKDSPTTLRSPTWLINFRRGNSFECATFLTSLLLGQGYNAFVVFGYASREQVQCDRTRITCPYLPKAEPKIIEEEHAINLTYKLKPPADFRSKFLLKMDAREKLKFETAIQEEEEKQAKIIMELEKPRPDKYHGHRVHAWVVVLPAINDTKGKQIKNPFFIESSSGEMYDLNDPQTNLLYLGVESIWNDENYWINIQEDSIGCDKINWDLTSTKLWEHLLPGEPWTMRGIEDDLIEEDIKIEQEKHLDMPASYVNEIFINSLDYERRYPQAHKTKFYKKVKVDLYSPYVQLDGLIEKITIYDDYEYTVPIEIYEKYTNRNDQLVQSQRNLNTNYVTDFYKRGRVDACKEHCFYMNDDNSSMYNERILHFYDVIRLDGLSEIYVHPLRLTQYYSNREDFLYYRDVEFSPDKGDPVVDGIHYRHIQRITEKYRRNELLPASRDISIREFILTEKEIHLKFHYEDDRITRGMRVYKKPEPGENLNVHTAVIQEYNPDAMSVPEQNLYLFRELEKLLKEEDQCVSNVRNAETEISSFIKTRTNEYLNPQLIISSFDRNRIEETGKSIKDSISISHSLRDITKPADHLASYLARIGNPKHISKAQAYLLREDCLSDFKDSQVNKANVILRKSEELTEELNKLQALLTQNEDLTREEEDELLAKTNEINFNLHLLEMKLDRHKNLVPLRYKMLVEFLQQDERLSILNK
ncbi:PREDICTED: dynein regulatory complex subunit 7 isoform X2 [Polistes canadensis]|uniref:dynein regulatory complex subunit 7 isoform X2 n=1 Tax=Polistes canadensis TaxID=91411 RepID=UPI000718B476|nr:PREDICTED: dynein regulatory complex subunit 7 isoform X2 [Polistes canadensis]